MQRTPLDLTVEASRDFAHWIAGIQRSEALANGTDTALWREFKKEATEVISAAEHLIYEGEIAQEQSAWLGLDAVLEFQPGLAPRLRLAIAHLDSAVGREALLACFTGQAKSRTSLRPDAKRSPR